MCHASRHTVHVPVLCAPGSGQCAHAQQRRVSCSGEDNTTVSGFQLRTRYVHLKIRIPLCPKISSVCLDAAQDVSWPWQLIVNKRISLLGIYSQDVVR